MAVNIRGSSRRRKKRKKQLVDHVIKYNMLRIFLFMYFIAGGSLAEKVRTACQKDKKPQKSKC